MKNIVFAAFTFSVMMTAPVFAGSLNGNVADCNNADVLKAIDSRFDHALLHKDQIAIESISRVHQHRLENNTARSPVARRYCGAVAHMSDGHKRTLWYLIEDGMGLAGTSDNVEFCVSGLDPMKAHDGRCRVLK